MEGSAPGSGPHAGPEELAAEAREFLDGESVPPPARLEALAALLRSPDPAEVVLGARVAGRAAASDDPDLARRGREILRRAAESGAIPAARRALQFLVTTEDPETFRRTLRRTLEAAPAILDDETVAILAGTHMRRAMAAVFAEVAEELLTGGGRPEAVEGMIRLVVAFGATHPSWYRRLRLLLTRGVLFGASATLRERAAAAREELEGSFRRWLGPVAHIAVARETGEEYGWDDVVAFDDAVPDHDRHRLLVAIKHSPLIREAILLLYGGATVELGDILPGGVWIQPVGRGHGKTVHRVTVQVRGGARYEIAVNLAVDLSRERQREETDWLIAAGEDENEPVVERFGGYWPSLGLWTEELIPGEDLETTLERLSHDTEKPDRFTGFWPYAVWSAGAAFVRFWERTARRLVVADPEPRNVFVPLHDYHASARLLSISERSACDAPACLLTALHGHLVVPTEQRYPVLHGHASWKTLFAAVCEAAGETAGLGLLETARPGLPEEVRPVLDDYLQAVRRDGFQPLRLHFAIGRYARWRKLNPEATPEACAQTVQELFSSYDLASLQPCYPETRVRFFRETVLAGAPAGLAAGLDELIRSLRAGTVQPSRS
ncbi:MAG TPA: hypothetical protein ENK19_09450, partial [Acidobacteria bacterium]|nr:hypothetical protein [Acidobacteriota bacterium]